MAIQVFCNCGNSLSVGAELAGKKVRCKACQEVLRIPEVPMEFSDDPDEEVAGDYEVVDADAADAPKTSCPACGADAAPQDSACLACGEELGGGGVTFLDGIPRPVLLGVAGLVALLLLGGIGKVAYTATRPGSYTSEGLSLLAAEDFQGSERAFKAALEYDSEHPGALTGLAKVGLAARDANLLRRYAKTALDRELFSDPAESAEVRVAYARVLLEEKKFGVASGEAQAAREEDPSVAGEAYAIEGLAHLSAGKQDAAITALRASLQARYEDATVLRELAQLLHAQGETAEARGLMERAVRVENAASHWLLLAQLRREEGDRDGTAEALQRAVSADPNDASAHALLSEVRLEQGKLDAALAAAQKAAELAPGDAAAQTSLGRVLLANDQPQEAMEPLAAALKVEADWEAEFLLGEATIKTGEVRKGLNLVLRSLKQRPDDILLHLRGARLAVDAEDAQRAVTILSDVVRRKPSSYDARVLMAEALTRKALGRKKHDAEIREQLEAAIAVDGRRREAPLALGLHYFHTLRPEEAIAAFDQGLSATARDAELLYYKGWACIRARRWDDAIKALEACLAVDSGYEDAKAKLEEAHEGKFYEKKN